MKDSSQRTWTWAAYKKTAKKMLVSLLVFALASPGFAQAPAVDQKHIESIKKKVIECLDKQRRVFLETYDDRRLQGSISEAGETDFVLSYDGQVRTLSYSEVKTLRWRSATWRQVKLLAVGSAIVGAIFVAVVLLGGLKG